VTRGLPPPGPRSLSPLSSTEFVEILSPPPPRPSKIPGYITADPNFDTYFMYETQFYFQTIFGTMKVTYFAGVPQEIARVVQMVML
jgi:hypothetical protein